MRSGRWVALRSRMKVIGGGRVRGVKDVVYAGANGGLALALDAPEEDWERLTA